MSNNNSYVDLHLHTVASDGTFTPESLIRHASSRGLKAIAVTDHDAWESIRPAAVLGAKLGIEVIPGVELSTTIGESEIHILGYFIDYLDPDFQKEVLRFKQARIERAQKIVEKLGTAGVRIDIKHVLEVAGSGSVGRPHVARALLDEGYVGSTDEAFSRYLGYGAPAYVPKNFMSPQDAFELIHYVRGLCFFAHPGIEGRDELIDQFAAWGLDGLEVWHSKHSPSQVKHYLELAGKKGMLVSGGSDSHGDQDLDSIKYNLKVTYDVVEKMKARVNDVATRKWMNEDGE
ncbi:MAG: PHP domain-containing protein [bacterium]|nr:PHP domain-containing protein [bacterium]